MDFLTNQKFNSLHHSSKFHQGSTVDNWYGDYAPLDVDENTIKQHANTDFMFFSVGAYQNFYSIYESCIQSNSNSASSDFVLLGVTQENRNNKQPQNVVCLFDTKSEKPHFFDNIIFIPVDPKAHFSEAAGFRFLGQYYAHENLNHAPKNRNDPIKNATLTLQILGKFNMETQTPEEQKALASIRANACQTLFDFLREKRNEVALYDTSKTYKSSYMKDVIKYYKFSKSMPLSGFIEYAEKELSFLEIKLKANMNKQNKNAKQTPLAYLERKRKEKQKVKTQKIQEKIEEKREKQRKKQEEKILNNFKL